MNPDPVAEIRRDHGACLRRALVALQLAAYRAAAATRQLQRSISA